MCGEIPREHYINLYVGEQAEKRFVPCHYQNTRKACHGLFPEHALCSNLVALPVARELL